MHIEQIYTGCLSQGAYLIVSEGEAAIVDPLRESQPYLDLVGKHQAKIKYIFETHFHADFVSGHVDLAHASGAEIVFGPSAETSYRATIAKDGQFFNVGKIKIKVLHTPGHTPESACFLVLDEKENPYCLFSGDTLFIGDVGRPDLAIKTDISEKDLAGMLYDSLRNKIMSLPDDLIIYPAHGAGSACGKNISKETYDTLGSQKQSNYALRDISREEFVQELTTGILPPPRYFQDNATLNKLGYPSFDHTMEKGMKKMSAMEVDQHRMDRTALILDVRKASDYAAGHIEGSWFIGLDGPFAPWAGSLIPSLHQPIVLVAEVGRESEAVMRLARVGFDHCVGYLENGIKGWTGGGRKLNTTQSIDAASFSKIYQNGDGNFIDVRKPGEYTAKHLEGIASLPLDFISGWKGTLEKDKKYFLHCGGGYRSMIAISILNADGKMNLVDIAGGFSAITKSEIPANCYNVTCTQA